MDFSYSEEQQMLTDSLARLLAENWQFEQRRRRQREAGLDAESWRQLAELGVLGLLVPQEYNGFGESAATVMLVHTELGRALVPEPVIPSGVLAARILSQATDAPQAGPLLQAIAGGSAVVAVAYLEQNRQLDLTRVAAIAQARESGFVLSGDKCAVWHPGSATHLIVSAQLDGEFALFVVPASAEGVVIQDFPTMDGTRAGVVQMRNVALDRDALLLHGAQAHACLQDALHWGVLALCAQAVGAMDRLLSMTMAYLNTRKQFGKPLAAFQVLSQTVSQMYVNKEVASAMAYVAAAALDDPEASERARKISSAKIKVAAAGRYIGEWSVQLHGGMGMTDELEVGDYFKRLTYVEYLLGDTGEHLKRLGALQ